MIDDFVQECSRFGINVIHQGPEDYLRDESRFRGFSSGLVRARDEEDVVRIVRSANKWRIPLTVAAGMTSLTGASVPAGGIVVDVKALNTIDGDHPTLVGPGVVVKDYKRFLESKGLFYPPDPTSEDSCTLGGNVACNASGALSYLYGPTRDYVSGLKMLLPFGAVLRADRGNFISNQGTFRLPPNLFEPELKTELLIPVPRLRSLDWNSCKSAAGLYSADPMDLVDLFIGSEGILGIILQIKTRLLPLRNPFFAMMIYAPTLDYAVSLVQLLDGLKRYSRANNRELREQVGNMLARLSDTGKEFGLDSLQTIVPSCMEWFGSSVAEFVSPARRPLLQQSFGALYVEQEYGDDEDPLDIASRWAELLDALRLSSAETLPEIRTEVALDARKIRSLRHERHAVPESLNQAIRVGMTKVGMDFAVPMKQLRNLFELYQESLTDVEWCDFGHIGNAHIHVNILPRDHKEMDRAKKLNLELAEGICRMGGTVSAEHGIGKLKHGLLKLMVGSDGIEDIRRVKAILDPRSILALGNMVSHTPE
ncbi:FAD-binding oxidoreductase [Thermodesulfobacteriota bacterium]